MVSEPNGSHLYLMVGLPGSGKTTRAKELESQRNALRLTPDEWILDLYGDELDREARDSAREPVESLQWKIATRVLAIGSNVVLDWGFWSRAERLKYRMEAEKLGATVENVVLDVPTEELRSRISGRPESEKGTLGITRQDLEDWSQLFELPTEDEL